MPRAERALPIDPMTDPVRILPCPTCRKPVQWAPANKHRPFCSERCRMIDFGSWANETYRIPGEHLEDVSSEGTNTDV